MTYLPALELLSPRGCEATASVIWLHGLGAMGEAGVTRCLEIIRKELDITMAFCGKTDIRQVDRSILLPPRR